MMKLVFGNADPEVALEVTDVMEEISNGKNILEGIESNSPILRISIRNTKQKQADVLATLVKADLNNIRVYNFNSEINEYELTDTIEGYTQLMSSIKTYRDNHISISLVKEQ